MGRENVLQKPNNLLYGKTEARQKRMDFRGLQVRQGVWQRKNFPAQTWVENLLGVQEELGELAHALLKQMQGIRGTPEVHEAEARDAVGDILIFLAGLCNTRDWDMQDIVQETWRKVQRRDWQTDPLGGGSSE